MISKTKIAKRSERKNPSLRKLIVAMKKINPELAGFLAKPRRQQVKLNLDEIDKKVKDGEEIIVPGKVLGKGELNKKITLSALSFSESALKKLQKKIKIIPLDKAKGRIIR